MKHVLIIAVLALSLGFVSKDSNIIENNNMENLTCSPPSIGNIIIGFNDFTITAVTRSPGADGYQWTVNGGTIISGQGTTTIEIFVNCPTTEVSICVRAFTTGIGGSICYSPQVCRTVDGSDYCFL